MSNHDSGSEPYIAQSLPRAQRDRPRQTCGTIDLLASTKVNHEVSTTAATREGVEEKYLWGCWLQKFAHVGTARVTLSKFNMRLISSQCVPRNDSKPVLTVLPQPCR